MSLKVKVARQSGLPIELKEIEMYEEEWKELYDGASKDADKDMLLMQELLICVDTYLDSKYSTVEEWDLLVDAEKIKDIIGKYGSFLTSTHKDTGDLMYIIMDQGLQTYYFNFYYHFR